MWEEIERRGQRYTELKSFIENPSAPSNPQYANWLREYGRLGKFGELWDSYKKAQTELAEAAAILKDSTDAELKAMAQEELKPAQAKVADLHRTLVDMQLNEDDDSSRNVI